MSAFSNIAKEIAALDAAKGQGMPSQGGANGLKNPTLGAMNQKNFMQGQPSMMGGRPRPQQGRPQPPQGGGMPPQGAMPPSGGGYVQRPQNRVPITPQNVSGDFQNTGAAQMQQRSQQPRRLASGGEGNYQLGKKALGMEAEYRNQQQAAIDQKTREVARMAHGQAVQAGMPPAQAQNIADKITEFPNQAPALLQTISDFREKRLTRTEDREDATTLSDREVAEKLRQEAVVEAREAAQRERRFKGLMANEVPEPLARAFAENPEDNQVEVLEYLHGRAEKLGDLTQQDFLQRKAKTLAYGEMDNTIKQIENTFQLAQGTGALGLASALTNKIPETPAYNTLASIDTQKAKNAFKALFDMRQASTTGGALGNVSNREIELLYSEFAALDPKMGDAFISNLADVLQRFEATKYMMQNEARFEAEGYSAEEMFEESTMAVNRRTARKMSNANNKNGTPQAALEAYYAGDVSKAAFKKEYGWTPISTVQDWDTETELKGVYER